MALNVNWLRQCDRAGLYEQGKAIYEKGGLNLANLTDEQQTEAEDDYRICVCRGRDEETKPRRQRPNTTEDDQEETTMTRTLYGKVRGKTIELDEDLGVAEGQEVVDRQVSAWIARCQDRAVSFCSSYNRCFWLWSSMVVDAP